MSKVALVYFDLHTGSHASLHHGLAYIIGVLKNDKHDVSFFHLTDENAFEPTRNLFNSQAPDVVGLSFATNQKKYVQHFLNDANVSRKLIIAGGVHCTLEGDRILDEFPQLDGICIGEGELPLKELCQRLDDDQDYLTTPSFIFKDQDTTIKNPVLPLQSLDDLPLPDYTLFDYQRIIANGGGRFPMMLGRGCPYACHYCCNHVLRQIYPNKSKYVRFPTVNRCLTIIRNNLTLCPSTRNIIFADDTLTINKEWLFRFCDAYAREIGLPFICNARVETIDDQVVQHLKRGGCVSINFGVESGNEWLRRHILNRNHSNKKIKEAFAITKKYGIRPFSYNIVGLPFETRRMARETLELNMDLRPQFGKCFYFYPYPGTRSRQLCEDFGLLRDDLESVSGYLEAPSLKGIFTSHSEITKHFELLQTYFYSRLLFAKLRVPRLLERFLSKVFFFFRRPILASLDPTSDAMVIRVLRRLFRKLALRYLR